MVADRLSRAPWTSDREILDVALNAAERAVELTKSQSPGMLDALAHIWFLRGDAAKAVEIESQTVRLSEGGMREAQQKNPDALSTGSAAEVVLRLVNSQPLTSVCAS